MTSPIDDSVKVEQLILERVMLALHTTVDSSSIHLHGTEARIQMLAHTADQFVVMLKGWMIGNKFPDRSEFSTFSYPDGWWEALKHEHAPKWFLKRWPVKLKLERWESVRYHYNICPHWNEPFSDRDKMFHYAYLAERPELAPRKDRY